MPHAAAFPSTSSSRSPSQSASWLSAPPRSAGPHDQHVVATRPGSARAASRQSSRSRRFTRFRSTAVPDALRHGEAEPRLAARRRAGTSRGRGSGSRRAAVTVDGVEVPRSRERRYRRCTRPARPASGGEPLPALRAAALQDRPAGASRHAGTEAVLALPPAYVGLVGPLHEVVFRTRKRRPRRPRFASIDERRSSERRVLHSPAHVDSLADGKREQRGCFSGRDHPFETRCPHLWRARVEPVKSLQIALIFGSTARPDRPLSGPRHVAMLALARREEEMGHAGWSNRLS